MDGWVWNGVEALAVALSSTLNSAAETPPRARLRNSRTPAGFRGRGGPLVCGPGAVSAPSNQLKAKRDGWINGGGMGWKLWPWP